MLKILLVLGDQTGDDIIPIKENDLINKSWLKETHRLIEIEPMDNPTIDEFRNKISELFHVIIIIGHSSANRNGLDGRIKLNNRENQQNSISITEVAAPFRQSVQHKPIGLKLVILAGCSSDAAGRRLVSDEIGVPNVITFNRPIYYGVAKVFCKELLRHWIEKSMSLEMAMSEAIISLTEFNSHYPSPIITPVFLTSIVASQQPPLMFSELAKSSTFGKFISIPLVKKLVNIRRINWLKIIGFILIGATLVSLLRNNPPKDSTTTAKTCSSIQKPSSILSSIGDSTLFPKKDISDPDKTEIEKLFSSCDYPSIQKELAEYKGNDPEIRWTKNNAEAFIKTQEDKSKQLITIPVISNPPDDSESDAISRGAVVAQQEINEKPGGTQQIVLRIVVDDNKADRAKVVAGKIVEFNSTVKEKYPAVLGHFESNASIEAAKIYEQNGLVMISAASSVTDLQPQGAKFIFRTVPNSKLLAEELAGYIEKSYKNLSVGFCYDSSLRAAESFRTSFNNRIKLLDIECDAKKSDSLALESIIKKMKDKGAKGLLTYFHLGDESFNKLKDIATYAKNEKLQLFGPHSLDSSKLIKYSGNLGGITIVTPRVRNSAFDSEFTTKFRLLFPGIEPTWRDMMAYDALKAISYGLSKTKNNTSQELRDELHKFSAQELRGSNGFIKFASDNGDRYVTPSIVKLDCSNNSCKFIEQIKPSKTNLSQTINPSQK
jgi:branched-chain amino acid transport system substrate-binding protein